MDIGKGLSFLVFFLFAMALSDSTAQTKSRATTSGVTPVSVIFTSLQSTFSADLQNPSSAAFMQRASMIQTQLGPIFTSSFSTYISMVVELFRPGVTNTSVINEIKLKFNSTSVPTNTEIANVMTNASRTVTGFNIEQGTFSVNGFVSSGIAHSSSLLTASCLTLLSFVLSRQQ